MLASATHIRAGDTHGCHDAPNGPLGALVGARPTRVGLLLVACVLMGLTDLACTLAYIGGVGMFEQNPVARAVIERGGAGWLIAFKLATMLVTGVCVYASRRHRVGEQCAWLSFLMLMALTLHWVRYNEQVVSPEIAAGMTIIGSAPDSFEVTNWVRLGD
ncbi:MAG: DUF5658 family protein [Planctomycetota bacterium]